MFLGMVNFYCRFLPGLTSSAWGLQRKKSSNYLVRWLPNCLWHCQVSLASAVLLEHPTNGCKLAITVDASDFAVGGSLDQFRDGSWHPLAFFSKKLTTTKRKYATFDRELLALYLGIKQFRHYVEGWSFTAFTDHKPLVGAMTNAVDRSPRQTRHLFFVAKFTNDVQYVSGRDNVVTDALSWTPTIASVLSLEINYRQLAANQATSDEIHAYRTAITGLKLEDVPFQDFTVLCDISTGYIRPIVPREWRRRILDTFTDSHTPVTTLL